jgi:hypothetical protein
MQFNDEDILQDLVALVEVAPKKELLGQGSGTFVAVFRQLAAAAAARAARAAAAAVAKATAEGATASQVGAAATAAATSSAIEAAAADADADQPLTYTDVLCMMSYMCNLMESSGAPGVHGLGVNGSCKQKGRCSKHTAAAAGAWQQQQPGHNCMRHVFACDARETYTCTVQSMCMYQTHVLQSFVNVCSDHTQHASLQQAKASSCKCGLEIDYCSVEQL